MSSVQTAIDTSISPPVLAGLSRYEVFRHHFNNEQPLVALTQLDLRHQFDEQKAGRVVEGGVVLRTAQLHFGHFANAAMAHQLIGADVYRSSREMFPLRDPKPNPDETTVTFLGTLFRSLNNQQIFALCLRSREDGSPAWRVAHRWLLGEVFGPRDYFAVMPAAKK